MRLLTPGQKQRGQCLGSAGEIGPMFTRAVNKPLLSFQGAQRSAFYCESLLNGHLNTCNLDACHIRQQLKESLLTKLPVFNDLSIGIPISCLHVYHV